MSSHGNNGNHEMLHFSNTEGNTECEHSGVLHEGEGKGRGLTLSQGFPRMPQSLKPWLL